MHETLIKAPSARAEGAFALSLASLSLSHFRNYASLKLELAPTPVILTGANGIGKTNILEAVSLLAPGRGLRGARPQELSHRENAQDYPWAVSALVRSAEGSVRIGTGKDPLADGEKRIVRIEGQNARSQNALAAHVSVLGLTPQMDQTLNESTTSRRQWLDKLAGIFYPDHTRQLAIYEHAKNERKRLLYDRRADISWVESLEERMAEQAIAIAAARLEAIGLLQTSVAEAQSPFPKARLAISGSVESTLAHGGNAIRAEEILRDELSHSRELDRETGKTNFGPHRSDFLVEHLEKNMPAGLCSTGEQKALLLGITLAAARAKSKWHGLVPILLFDEVVAHLDEDRRASLFDEIVALKAQCWMTGTDTHLFTALLPKAQHFSLPFAG